MLAGYQRMTAPGAIHAAGTPVVVYAINISTTGGAGVVDLSEGSDDMGNAILECLTAADISNVTSWPGGVAFPTGCWAQFGVNVNQMTLVYTLL